MATSSVDRKVFNKMVYDKLADVVARLADFSDGEFMFGEITGTLANTIASRTDGASMPSLFARVTYNQYYIITWYYPAGKMFVSRYIVSTQALSTIKATLS